MLRTSRYTACPVDGSPVDQTPERRGPAGVYCSSACRQKAYRARRKAMRNAVVTEAEQLTRDAADPIPAALRDQPRWLRWVVTTAGKKLPLRADVSRAASSTDPRTWTDYDTARDSSVGSGVGFALGGGIGCIDLDDALDEHGEVISAVALAVLDANPGAWVERSMSGRGLHVFGYLPEGPGRTTKGLEVYSVGRYIAVTGEVFQPGGLVPLVVPGAKG